MTLGISEILLSGSCDHVPCVAPVSLRRRARGRGRVLILLSLSMTQSDFEDTPANQTSNGQCHIQQIHYLLFTFLSLYRNRLVYNLLQPAELFRLPQTSRKG